MDKFKEYGVEIGPGWEREERKHFDEIVLNYEKSRWDYPDLLFKDVLKYNQAEPGKKAIEIGAGTGKVTAPFLDAGYVVTAVEMGQNMSDFLIEKYKGYKNFNVITSTFEDVKLENETYDLIYAASAFHWVESEIGCPKAYRLLKAGGTIALFRNSKFANKNEKLYEDIQEFYKEYYHKPYKPPEKKGDLWSPREILRGYGFENLTDYGFTDISTTLYEADISRTADEYIALMDTMSDHRSLPDNDRESLYAGIKNAINNHGGEITNTHVFQLYMGKKP